MRQRYIYRMDTQRALLQMKIFLMLLNFVRIMNLYKQFRIYLHAGDAVAIKWIYREYFPILLYMKKSHYVEIILVQMEKYYDVLPHHILQLV